VRVLTHADGDGLAVVEITEHGRSCDYLVSRIPSDFGLGFRWAHADPVPVLEGVGREQVYWCLLEADGRSCSCPGFIRWGHCRHADVTLELVQAGKL
jgi:hypothetical protein